MKNLRHFLNQEIGFVRINKPIIYTDQNYECAAWWEERTSETGVFPLLLRPANDLYPERLELDVSASVPAVVSNDYFPALWGGVPVSSSPYKPKNIGRKSSIIVKRALVQAIIDTGNSQSDTDWYVNPDLWPLVIKDQEKELVKVYNDLPKWWDEYKSGDDEYHSRVGMVGYFGNMLRSLSKDIKDLYRVLGYLQEKSPMWRRLHIKNTAWIPENAVRPDWIKLSPEEMKEY